MARSNVRGYFLAHPGEFLDLQRIVQPLKDVLGIPDDLHFVCVVTLGYPAERDPTSARSSRRVRGRKPLDEVVRWERW